LPDRFIESGTVTLARSLPALAPDRFVKRGSVADISVAAASAAFGVLGWSFSVIDMI
jgi:hypothetical protein